MRGRLASNLLALCGYQLGPCVVVLVHAVYGEDRFTRCGVCTPQPCAFVGVGTAVHCRVCGRQRRLLLISSRHWSGLALADGCVWCADVWTCGLSDAGCRLAAAEGAWATGARPHLPALR